MESNKPSMASIVVFILALLVFLLTVFLVFVRPELAAKSSKIEYNTQNVDIGDVSTQVGNTGRYYKGFVVLEVVGKKTPELIEKKMPQIKDTILDIISTSEVKDLTGDRKEIKQKIVEECNAILGGEVVVDANFTESIVQ